jgi:hypothetical protein
MPASVLLPQFFLPQSAVKLGRFVTNVDEPHRHYHDPSPRSDFNVVEKVATNYDIIDTLADSHNFASELTSFLAISISSRTKTAIRITTQQVKTYYLDNNGQWFRDAVQSEDVRKWIERILDEGEEIYVVVGYHTILDAHITEQSDEERRFGGKLEVPISTALAATGVVAPLGSLIDPSLANSHARTKEQQRQFVAQGEQIVAVQYRKLRFRLFSSKSIAKATLAKATRWERYDRPRYLQNDGDDMVEVELDDDLTVEGDREQHIVGSGEIFFSAPKP